MYFSRKKAHCSAQKTQLTFTANQLRAAKPLSLAPICYKSDNVTASTLLCFVRDMDTRQPGAPTPTSEYD